MSLVLDTSAVLAAAIRADEFHAVAARALTEADEDLVTTPLAVAEMDHLVTQRGGRRAAQALWADLESGGFLVRWWADAMVETLTIARAHPRLGLTDASLVALADRLRTDRVLTFDQHFDDIETPEGRRLTVLPERT